MGATAAWTFAVLAMMMWSVKSFAGATGTPTDCSNQFTEMVPCLSFVEGGEGTSPSEACCAAIKDVRTTSPICLCELIAPGGAGTGGSGINSTLALMLPGLCKVQADPSQCTALLNGTAIPAPSPPTKAPSAKPKAPRSPAISGSPSTSPAIASGGSTSPTPLTSPSTSPGGVPGSAGWVVSPSFRLLVAALASSLSIGSLFA